MRFLWRNIFLPWHRFDELNFQLFMQFKRCVEFLIQSQWQFNLSSFTKIASQFHTNYNLHLQFDLYIIIILEDLVGSEQGENYFTMSELSWCMNLITSTESIHASRRNCTNKLEQIVQISVLFISLHWGLMRLS